MPKVKPSLRARCHMGKLPEKRKSTHTYRGLIDSHMQKLFDGLCDYIVVSGDEFGRQSVRSVANYKGKLSNRKVSTYIDTRGRLIVHMHPDDRIANGAPS